MARRRRAEIRKILPDPRHNSVDLAKFINNVMLNGKKTVAQQIVYSALELAEGEAGRSGFEVFEQAIRNATPMIEVRSRRVGGANYQVPTEVRPTRRLALAMRWIVTGARLRSGRGMAQKLSAELLEASRGQGAAVRRKEEVFRMAEANRAFAHYRW
ncbi:MAG: 30S ribosomal protein S7 [Chloroflexota bacterium]|jgi:small subunit ribosomal protein S7|uniref:Small ribosomal subunit protein uS7 domain-containing protein n=1 Tax=marine metagenome TaxID=408172 RepID=A0A382B8Y2_9ZZZZ|nr:30S ribosomal protein S7 [Chloroflexota bacterium]|tara:strand:- start:375 stop:845 length:471 start_codon:yes stop_codon:yes gene_type:complete